MSTASVLAWCRAGFEGECARELTDADVTLGGGGYARARPQTGWVQFVARETGIASQLAAMAPAMIFPRQVMQVIAEVPLPREDRLGVILPPIQADPRQWCDAWIESPDTNEGRELAPLCRSLNAALVARLKREQGLDRGSPWRLHVGLTDATHAWIAATDIRRASPWPGGIPRLRFPRQAPSRSTLKLEEAFLVLLDADEREAWLQPGMRAVDLGAAPGGWTWQFVQRSIHVTAIDNGPMDEGLMESGLVEHRREDGFRYQPHKPVDWLVCDMVEQPRRVAARMAHWLSQRWCRQAMFNLKLPMKKRFDEVHLCLDQVRDAAPGVELRARQLYHDREEITVFARLRA